MKIFFEKNMEEVLQMIFLSLDRGSLHTSRQVCHQWNEFIQKLWKSRYARNQLTLKFSRHFLTCTPRVSTALNSDWNILSIAVDNKLIVCGMDRGRVLVLDKHTEKTMEMLEATLRGYISAIALGNTVIVASMSDSPSSGEVTINVWNKASMALRTCITLSSPEMVYFGGRFEKLGIKAADGDKFLCLGGTYNSVRVFNSDLEKKWELVHEPEFKVTLVETSGPWVATSGRTTLEIRFWNLEDKVEGKPILVKSEQLGDLREIKDCIVRCMDFQYPTLRILINSKTNSVKNFIIQNWSVSTGSMLKSIYSNCTKLYRPKLRNGLLFTTDVKSNKVSIYFPTEKGNASDEFLKNEIHHVFGMNSILPKTCRGHEKKFIHVDSKCLIITEPLKVTFYGFFK